MGIWCKGSTRDFDSLGIGSNPIVPANISRCGVTVTQQSPKLHDIGSNPFAYANHFNGDVKGVLANRKDG